MQYSKNSGHKETNRQFPSMEVIKQLKTIKYLTINFVFKPHKSKNILNILITLQSIETKIKFNNNKIKNIRSIIMLEIKKFKSIEKVVD